MAEALDHTSVKTRVTTPSPPGSSSPQKSRRRFDFGVARFSGLYIMILLMVVFSSIESDNFATLNNFRVILQDQAITGILTLAVVVSLISGAFDLSVAANMSWSLLFVAWLQSSAGISWPLAVIITLLSGTLIGVANAIVITKLNIDSVIATLGMSSILAAITYALTQGQSIVEGINPTYSKYFGDSIAFGIPTPVYYLAGLALLLWYVLDHTPFGRYLRAVGANLTASRLAGLHVTRLQWGGLLLSATLASLAGVVFTAQVSNAAFGGGSSYLLPAFTGAFLGFTQITPGRFNVWGTIVALYLLQVGISGLLLKWPEDPWVSDLFEGLVLIVAVAFAVRARRMSRVAPA